MLEVISHFSRLVVCIVITDGLLIRHNPRGLRGEGGPLRPEPLFEVTVISQLKVRMS